MQTSPRRLSFHIKLDVLQEFINFFIPSYDYTPLPLESIFLPAIYSISKAISRCWCGWVMHKSSRVNFVPKSKKKCYSEHFKGVVPSECGSERTKMIGGEDLSSPPRRPLLAKATLARATSGGVKKALE